MKRRQWTRFVLKIERIEISLEIWFIIENSTKISMTRRWNSILTNKGYQSIWPGWEITAGMRTKIVFSNIQSDFYFEGNYLSLWNVILLMCLCCLTAIYMPLRGYNSLTEKTVYLVQKINDSLMLCNELFTNFIWK